MQHGSRDSRCRSGVALRPLAVSALAKRLIAGGAVHVQAVHASGVSLVAPGRPDLCYASGTGRGLLPLHLVLRESDLHGLLRRLDDTPEGQPVALDLAGVRVFSTQLAAGSVEPSPAAVTAVAAWLRAQGDVCGLGSTVAQALDPAGLVRRTLALAESGARDGEQALRALIGRGVGSTPAADDVLVGALAHSIATAGLDAPLVRLLRRLAPEFDRLTTAAGATYLRAALEGAFGSDLLAFVRALSLQPVAHVLRRAKRVAAHGATSGLDTLVGFIAAHEQALAVS